MTNVGWGNIFFSGQDAYKEYPPEAHPHSSAELKSVRRDVTDKGLDEIMSTTAGALIQQHPTNPVHQSEHTSASTKTWAQKYAPIKSLKIQTAIQENGAVEAIFDGAFLGTYDDDALRMKEPAYPPNAKYWRLAYEADGNNYFQAEISNIVLATFAQRPLVIQAAEEKPLTDKSVTEAVDVTYSVKKDTTRMHITIGEMKRCLVAPRDWQTGHLRKQQQSLSQELRGCVHRSVNPSHLLY